MSNINFDNPWLLFIALPLIAVFLVPFFITVRKDNRNGHNIASAVMHVAMAIIIAFACAGTNIQTVISRTSVYVVADVSYSSHRNLDTVDSYVKNVSRNMPSNSQMGVIAFGKDYKLITRLGGRFSTVKNSGVDESETNITEALAYAGTLFEDDVIKRIVLISDGMQSDRRDANGLKRAVDELSTRGITVDAMYLNNNIPADVHEVQISSAEFTQNAFMNKEESVTAIVQSNRATSATVYLDRDGENIDKRTETLTAGYNSFTFELDTSAEGTFDYEIRVEANDDGSHLNNRYLFTQTVSSDVKILFLTEEAEDLKYANELYGHLDGFEGYNINVTPAVPYSIEELSSYDEFILSNIDVTHITNAEMFVDSLDTAVSVFGKSLVTMGNTYLQNKDSVKNDNDAAVLDKYGALLPVNFGNSDQGRKLYTLVIDRSRSMEQLYKFRIAKAAATHLVENLNDEDWVCVVAFDSNIYRVLTPVCVSAIDEKSGLTNRDNLIENIIPNLEVKQGTVIGSGLKSAYELISRMDFVDKQIMLISDGLNYGGDPNEPLEVVKELRGAGVTTSVLDVGRGAEDGALQESQIALKLLKDIAETGAANGKPNYFYVGNNLDNLQNVVFGEMDDIARENTVLGSVWLDVQRRYDGALDGLSKDPRTYSVSGYYYSTAKPRATTVLSAKYYPKRDGASAENVTPKDAPIYAYWKPSNGTVSSFTSSFTGEWVSALKNAQVDVEGENSSALSVLFGNIYNENIPAQKADRPYTLSVEREGSYATVEITPAELHPAVTAQVKVVLPGGEELESQNMTFNSVSYTYSFHMPTAGEYGVTVIYNYGEFQKQTEAGFSLGYTEEYDEFLGANPAVLHRAVVGNGGTVSEDGNIKLVNDSADVQMFTMSLTVPFMIISAVLWVADIVVRKLKWADIKSFFKKGEKKKEGGK